jgi:hypothetical protein
MQADRFDEVGALGFFLVVAISQSAACMAAT